MKKLPVLLCIFLLSACAPSELPSDKLLERNGLRYEINSQTPFTGVVTEYWENGQLMFKTTFKDGELNGLHEWYHENGQEPEWSPICYQNGEKVDISKCKSL